MTTPVWQTSLDDALLTVPAVVLTGNVQDLVYSPSRAAAGGKGQAFPFLKLSDWLALHLQAIGYGIVAQFDSIDGLTTLNRATGEQLWARLGLPGQANLQPGPPGLDRLGNTVKLSFTRDGKELDVDALALLTWVHRSGAFAAEDASIALIISHGSADLKMRPGEDSLVFAKLLGSVPPPWSGITGKDVAKRPSRLIAVYQHDGHVPRGLTGESTAARLVTVPLPDKSQRQQLLQWPGLFPPGGRALPPEQAEADLDKIVNLTDGETLHALASMSAVSWRERKGLVFEEFAPLFRQVRFGVKENKWASAAKTLAGGFDFITARVRAQDDAVKRVVSVLKQAAKGTTDLISAGEANRPRGVFMFVGPTGVGKTETAKAIAELLFGDEKAMIRFDMSEFGERHSVSRMFGAPPGYLGHDEGGQLTNAVLKRPYSVLLFDEIEKAHRDLLNPFLQVFDDGRLTSSSGQTVYFSNTVIILTSNMGTTPGMQAEHAADRERGAIRRLIKRHPGTDYPREVKDLYKLLSDLDYDELQAYFRDAVTEEIRERMGKPELVSRIGVNNILTFNFIKSRDDKMEIIEQQIRRVNTGIGKSMGVRVEVTKELKELIFVNPNGTMEGGRGIRNLVQDYVVNPMTAALDERDSSPADAQKKALKLHFPADMASISETLFDTPSFNPIESINARWM